MWDRTRRGYNPIPPKRRRSHVLVALLIMLFGWPYGFVQAVSESDLTEISIEDLMEQKVTSVSKIEQTFFDTGAAVFVVTQDDLRG